jgi:hypothetical protein
MNRFDGIKLMLSNLFESINKFLKMNALIDFGWN